MGSPTLANCRARALRSQNSRHSAGSKGIITYLLKLIAGPTANRQVLWGISVGLGLSRRRRRLRRTKRPETHLLGAGTVAGEFAQVIVAQVGEPAFRDLEVGSQVLGGDQIEPRGAELEYQHHDGDHREHVAAERHEKSDGHGILLG